MNEIMKTFEQIKIGKLYRCNRKFMAFSDSIGWTHVNQNEIIIFLTVEKPKRYKNDPIFIYQILKDNGQLVTKVDSPETFHSFITKL